MVNRKVLTSLLKSQGCEVTIAVNGAEGVRKFFEDSFDIVLMDIQMPVMDGLTATRTIREHEIGSGKRTRIIAVTAGVDRETCLRAGMDDHLYKPVRLGAICSVLEHDDSSVA